MLLPKSPDQINSNYNPLELGLKNLISWNKGCYIGQEVISRLDSYDKVSRALVCLESAEGPSLAVVKKTALTSEGFLTRNGKLERVVSSAR